MPASAARASDDVLLRLLRILRDRGSITAEEFDELSEAARAASLRVEGAQPEDAAPPQTPARGAIATQAVRVMSPEPVVAAAPPSPPPPPPAPAAAQPGQARDDVARPAPARWYDRIGLRGYTQFRFSTVAQGEGPELEIPADRSVNENETFIIRRGRVVLSGDVTNHLFLYAQTDFNGSTGAADYSLQMRDLYADVAFDRDQAFRVRLGQSKVPFGWVNMQSSQNRAPFERPDAINSAVEGERDYGAYFMWASREARTRLRDLTSLGLKGSGDYGVLSAGLYNGQGLNRSDQNGDPHVMARLSYPFKLASGQYVELGVQAYHGNFVPGTQAISAGGLSWTPSKPADGVTDQRVGVTAVWYPQPLGIEAEWNFGKGPELSDDWTRIEARGLQGGYVQAGYRRADAGRSLFPFARWQYYDGGRKFARNAPPMAVNELDLGVEFARWAELEITLIYTRTFERTRTSTFPFESTKNANRLGFQAQWNY